jgi:Skp family chaperone for outer membrane proteins
MRYGAAMIALLLAAFASCSNLKKKDGAAPPPVIRYMSMKAIYNFSLNRNRDALDVRKKLDEKISRMKEVESDLNEPATDHVALLEEYRKLDVELAALKGRSRYYKTKILGQIDRAVKNVAKTAGADFIYNIGDELIYAKKEYDVTEEIMQEIVRLEERSAPESR